MDKSATLSGASLCAMYASTVVTVLGQLWTKALGSNQNDDLSDKVPAHPVGGYIPREDWPTDPFSVKDWLSKVGHLSPNLLEVDLRYHFYVALNNQFFCSSYDIASDLLIDFCACINAQLALANSAGKKARPVIEDFRNELVSKLLPIAQKRFEKTPEWLEHPSDALSCVVGFFVLASSVEYFRMPSWSIRSQRWELYLNTSTFDFEFLRSALFGLWSSVPGINDLFGGGGPYMFRADSGQRGRIFVIEGGVGYGKSTLALALAADVCRKGGLAWVIPFEQSGPECERYIRDHAMIPAAYNVQIGRGLPGMKSTVAAAASGNGCMLLARGTKDSYKSMFAEIANIVASHERGETTHRVRCVVIDPINAIFEDPHESSAEGRDDLLNLIESIRDQQINLIFVAEATTNHQENRVQTIEKLADVVIRLSRPDASAGYSQRFIEVVKCRKQREQRGQHPYSIRSGTGVHIFPASPAIAARIQNRQIRPRERSGRFGWKAIDDLLGQNAFLTGDVIVFRGPSGTLKTELAVAFSLCIERNPNSASKIPKTPNQKLGTLFVPLKDSASAVRRLLDRNPSIIQRNNVDDAGVRSQDQVRILELPSGYMHPGVFFWHIEEELRSMRARGLFVDRMVFDNTEQWDINCPFISKDPTFASTMVDFSRRHGITTLFVSHASSEAGPIGKVEESLLSSSDVTLVFWRYNFGGKEAAAFRVVETRSMEHDRDHFDLSMVNGRLTVGVRAKQFRFDEGGRVTSIPIKLYLHSEGCIHQKYNEEICSSLRPVLSRDAEVESRDRTYVLRWLDLNAFSTVDEVQVLQLDEFQMPILINDQNKTRRKDIAPLRFSATDEVSVLALGDELSGNLRERVGFPDINNSHAASNRSDLKIFALPYFQNIGVLIINSLNVVGANLHKTLCSWREIAEACEEWEAAEFAKNDSGSCRNLFFDFACDKNETYICLLLEMALGNDIPKPSSGSSLSSWMEDNKGDFVNVLRQYALLTHRSHRLHPGKSDYRSEQILIENNGSDDETSSMPVVWRQWFTTATELFSSLRPEIWSSLHVQLLPKGACVAGEWYLAIPSYSAAPEFGAKIVRHLISADEEFERLRLGVGLPVRKSFFDPARIGADTLRCRFFGLPAVATGEALRNAIRRSEIPNYASVSSILSFHLKRMIEVKDIWHTERMSDVEDALEALIRNLREVESR